MSIAAHTPTISTLHATAIKTRCKFTEKCGNGKSPRRKIEIARYIYFIYKVLAAFGTGFKIQVLTSRTVKVKVNVNVAFGKQFLFFSVFSVLFCNEKSASVREQQKSNVK